LVDKALTKAADALGTAADKLAPNGVGTGSPHVPNWVVQNENSSEKSGSTQTGNSGTSNAGTGSGAQSDKETGSYTNTHESGKTYSGKGDRARSQASGKRVEEQTGDKHTATDWKPSANDREAYKDESRRLDANGGANSSSNHNKRESPGKKYRNQDGSN
jgi:hypothetical protein